MQQSLLELKSNTVKRNEEHVFYIRKYLLAWPVFLLSIILAICGAYLLLRFSMPLYKSQATILIKEKDSMASPFEELGVFSDSKVLSNEIGIMQSRTLAQNTVKSLQLNITYFMDLNLQRRQLYKDCPIKWFPIDMGIDMKSYEFTFKYLGGSEFNLSTKDGFTIKAEFGRIIRSRFGTWKIDNVQKLNRFKDSEITIKVISESAAALNLSRSLSISTLVPKSDLLEITLTDADPQRGRDILDQLVVEYNRATMADKNTSTENALHFVQGRLDSLSAELNVAERNVEAFKSTRGLTNISSESQIFLENAKSADNKINEIEIQLAVIKSIEKFILYSNESSSTPSTLGLSDPILLNLISNLSTLEAEKSRLLTTGTINSPLLTPIISQIAATKRAIIESLGVLRRTLETTRIGTTKVLSRIEGSIRNVPKQEREFVGLQRQQSIKDNLVTFLLQKREDVALAFASTTSDSRVVDRASSDSTPVSPKPGLTYGIALLIGLFVPGSFIFVKDFFNTHIESADDIKLQTLTPIVGEIMYKKSTEVIAVTDNSRSAVSEQFRALRTNLQFLHGIKKNKRITLVTSSMSGEGKSFIALNVGVSLAISNRKTVLLELDLRKPKISKYLQLSNSVGLSNFLIDTVSAEEIIKPSGVHPNLFVIGSGPMPPNPAELLEGDKIEKLIEYLKLNFDEIIFDTPPIGLVTDSLLLSRLADVSLYIVRHGYTKKAQISLIDQLYQHQRFPKLAIVFNAVNTSVGSAYGYGYGYYADDNESYGDMSISQKFKNAIKRNVN